MASPIPGPPSPGPTPPPQPLPPLPPAGGSAVSSRIRNKLIRWAFFSVLLGAFPIAAAFISALTRQKGFALDQVLAKGELLLLSVALSAAAAGEIVGTDSTRLKSTRILGVSLNILIVVVSTYWFADIAGASIASQPIDTSMVSSGSLIVFASSIVHQRGMRRTLGGELTMQALDIGQVSSIVAGMVALTSATLAGFAYRNLRKSRATLQRTVRTQQRFSGSDLTRLTDATKGDIDAWRHDGIRIPDSDLDFREVLTVYILKRLADTSISEINLRVAGQHLLNKDLDELENTTLFIDGAAVYESKSEREVADLMKSGRVFSGISVAAAVRDLGARLGVPS